MKKEYFIKRLKFTPKSFIGLSPSHSSQEIYFDYKLLSFISAKVIVKKSFNDTFSKW